MQILQYAEGRWIVEGSKGKEYHVKAWVKFDSITTGTMTFACDCPGSIYRGHCKHIEAVRIPSFDNQRNLQNSVEP